MTRYRWENEDQTSVFDAETKTSGITPVNREWTEFQKWLDDGNMPDARLTPSASELIDSLWQAANKYQQSRLDANGRIEIKRLADTGCPKATAIENWVKSIWMEYYARKEEIIMGNAVSMDFSSLGEMPHNFYEAYFETIE